MTIVWNVYREDFNHRAIVKYNIFDHGGFSQDVKKLLEKNITKTEFAEQINRSLRYWFWCKSEHEIVLSSWPVYIDKAELNRLNTEYEEYNNKCGHYPYKINVTPDVDEKVSIYDQVMMNWDQFVEYVWSNMVIIDNKFTLTDNIKENFYEE